MKFRLKAKILELNEDENNIKLEALLGNNQVVSRLRKSYLDQIWTGGRKSTEEDIDSVMERLILISLILKKPSIDLTEKCHSRSNSQ